MNSAYSQIISGITETVAIVMVSSLKAHRAIQLASSLGQRHQKVMGEILVVVIGYIKLEELQFPELRIMCYEGQEFY